jgi:predicted dehydrogenase
LFAENGQETVKDIKVGVIGCGYWGPNLIRNFNDCIQTDLVSACDLVQERLQNIKIRYPRIRTYENYKNVLRDKNIEAVVVATPVSTHYRLVRDALEAGKHVFVEKPLTSTVKEAGSLVNLALKKKLVLLVDHIFIYTDAVRKIKEYVSGKELGEIYYFDSIRINLGLFQNDVNVIWDLAPHDFAVMDYLLTEKPVSVIASGVSHTSSGFEDIAYITLQFKGDLIAHFHVNWMSPVKIRRIVIGGSKKMLLFDDLDPSEKIKIYDKGIKVAKADKSSVYRSLIQYRLGDMYAPSVDNTEALKVVVSHFADCIKNAKTPITDGAAGLRVVRMLEKASMSLKKGGVKVAL